MKYQLVKSIGGFNEAVVLHRDDGTILGIPMDPANTDYAAYLAWLAEGNTPLPAEDPQEVTP